MDKICVGVDIGGTSVKIGFFTENGENLHKWEIATRKENGGVYILPDVANSILETLDDKDMDIDDVIGIGIGVPGPVVHDEVVVECVNLGWGRTDVVSIMRSLTGIDNIKAENDANVAALGEMWKGGGQGYNSLVLVTLGTGVGGGIISDGKILTGSNGAAGEIGHITVNFNESVACNCGKKGCLEQYASATGVVNETKKALAASNAESVLRGKEHLSAKAIFDAAKHGDAFASQMVENLCEILGKTLAHIAHVVDPQVFVIGGGVSKAGQMLTDRILAYYNDNVMLALKDRDFRLAKLGNDAGIYGSARLILE
ncbi:ROK family glucokinase [Acetivibrio ethanolgignens]|uniref:Glucokinase n=1 Tax=Acetivibrio ethanolgignens TaxID=290052 RepID=A0A0V8QBK0_9FIRM|nr:ROK family glucokinase [Acetivibrio ethanolgignens]KSV57967.1 glucokinase [Acetivibrio ethanolgignens]